ncbi:MAG: porin family protein [Chlorobiaceae bacterium]|nr:porin family protein [Chlorobiaceae bacterium]
MKKSLSLLAVLAVAGVVSAPAQASTRYVSAMAGVNWLNDTNASATTDYVDDEPFSNKLLFDSGFTATAAVGCDYGAVRAEIEAGYQQGDFGISGEDGYGPFQELPYGEDYAGFFFGSGKSSVYSLMLNGAVDIPVGGGVELYAMAGLGVAQVNLEATGGVPWEYGDFSYGSNYGEDGVDDVSYKAHSTTLAYQLGAGIAIPLSKGVKLDARYRYFATTDFTITAPDHSFTVYDYDGYNSGTYDSAYWTPQANMNVSSHSLLLGLRVDI